MPPSAALDAFPSSSLRINGAPWIPGDPDSPGGASSRGPHRLQGVKQCNLKWFLRYGDEKGKGRLLSVAKDKVPLIGTAVHTRAAFHHAREMPSPPAWASGDVEAEVAKDVKGHPEAPALQALSASMWQAVVDLTPERDWPIAHSVEREVYAPLGAIDPECPPSLRDEVVTARLDLIATQGKGPFKGQLVIWDYKTTGGYKKRGEEHVTLPRWEGKNPWWSMHFQAALGLSIARAMFDLPVVGFYIIRVSREAPHVVDRHVLRVPVGVMSAAGKLATEAVIEEQRVLERRAKRLAPLMTGVQTGHCGDYGGCEYLPLCQASSPEVRKALIEADYFRQRV